MKKIYFSLILIAIAFITISLLFYKKQQGRVVEIVAGNNHNCALLKSSHIKCWGFNKDGQLGDGTTVNSSRPVFVVGIKDAVDLAAGETHTCAVLKDGTAKCWGNNEFSQLGNRTKVNSLLPSPVSGLYDAKMLAAGDDHTCALLKGGTVDCWGVDPGPNLDKRRGQLGNPALSHSPVPVKVSNIVDAIQIASGDDHTCVVLANRSVKCWGNNHAGQLGNGITVVDGVRSISSSPVSVLGISNAVTITGGDNHICAVLKDGRAACWGENLQHQLGSDIPKYSSVPVFVSNISNGLSIAGGRSHTCVLLKDGRVECWGLNDHGQLGDGTRVSSINPVFVVGIRHAIAITTGRFYSCALLKTGVVKCWGDNQYGQLGDQTRQDSSIPVAVKF